MTLPTPAVTLKAAVDPGPRSRAPAIEVARLSKVFGVHVALREVNFTLPRGAILVVLGPNGAGKTTLVRVLATLVRPTAGTARVGGFDLLQERDRIRRLIGVAGHASQLYPDLTPLENLAFAAALRGLPTDPRELRAALSQVGLEAQADLRVRQLSTGMQRRATLARALLGDPEVLLLDEPFTGLDQESLKRLEARLQAFRARGGAAVLVTHSLARGLAVADRVLLLAGGRVVADEPRGELTEAGLRHLYAAATGDA